MSKRIGYLCGGINGLSDAECNDWRNRVIAELPQFQWLNPMRRDYRGKEGESAREIVEGDLDDISRSHFILANTMRPSWGTGMEIYAAATQKKPVISICDGVVSPWLRFHSLIILPTLDEAIRILRMM